MDPELRNGMVRGVHSMSCGMVGSKIVTKRKDPTIDMAIYISLLADFLKNIFFVLNY